MNATELIVELVLTGILALAALLLPVLASVHVQPELTAETIALWIAIGFLLGVVIDRCADSLLGRWEGFIRCRYANAPEVETVRAILVGTSEVKDVFPEGWMRVKMMSKGTDGIVKWMDQSRVRIRIARIVAVLVPALTVSSLAALDSCSGTALTFGPGWCATVTGDAWPIAFYVPVIHLVFLILCFVCAEWCSKLRPPRTDHAPFAKPGVWVAVCSASSLWFTLELVVAVVLVSTGGEQGHAMALAVLIVGTLLTALASLTWWRLIRTFMGFVWTFCRSEHSGELLAEMGVKAPVAP